MYLRIQGLLENAGHNTLDDLIPLAERNAGKVALTSPLAFLLVAREHYRAFKNHNEDERILQVEMNRLVTIVMCALPSFAAYINHTLPQMRLVQPLCFNGVQYAINREHWEMLLYLPMRSFHFPEELAPLPQHLDIFAQFPFTYLAVADGVRNAMEGRDCYASVHRMHIWTASIETPAVQWMFRIRMALAYHDSEEVRAYLESTKGWQDMLSSAVKYLRVAGLHNVNARNTRTIP